MIYKTPIENYYKFNPETNFYNKVFVRHNIKYQYLI